MIPLPMPSAMTQPFWDALVDGVLVVPECSACGRRFFNPEPACIHCGATDWTWVTSPGRGEVYTLSVVHQAVVPGQPVPFVLAAVDMDDGWTMLTHIVEVDPVAVHIGQRVRCSPTLLRDGVYLPTFVPDPG